MVKEGRDVKTMDNDKQRQYMPLQPVYKDEHGTFRFKKNAIVRFLLDKGGIDLNMISKKEFDQEDREQFASLIGYSLSGFAELEYVSDEAMLTSEKIAEGIDETEARNIVLREQLDGVRKGLKETLPHVFRIHPDDLEII